MYVYADLRVHECICAYVSCMYEGSEIEREERWQRKEEKCAISNFQLLSPVVVAPRGENF